MDDKALWMNEKAGRKQNAKGKIWGKQIAQIKRGRGGVEDKVRKQAVLM